MDQAGRKWKEQGERLPGSGRERRPEWSTWVSGTTTATSDSCYQASQPICLHKLRHLASSEPGRAEGELQPNFLV